MSRRLQLFTICLLALATRLAFIAWSYSRGLITGLDSIETDSWETVARQLALGHGYVMGPGLAPTAVRTPLYPLFVAGVYRLFGLQPLPLLLVQACLGAATAVAVVAVARHVVRDERAALAAGLLWAIYPLDIAGYRLAASESLFLLLCALALWAYLRALEHSTAPRAMALGLLLGLCALTRDLALGLALLALAGWLLAAAAHRDTWRHVALAAAVFLAAWLPWPIRNAVELHAFVPTSTMGGYVLWATHLSLPQPDFISAPGRGPQFDVSLMRDPGWEIAWDRQLRGEALALIATYPERYALMALNRWPRLWFGVSLGRAPGIYELVFAAWNLALLALAVAGWRRARSPARWVVLGIVAAVTLAHMLVAASPRYFMPAMTGVTALAASASSLKGGDSTPA